MKGEAINSTNNFKMNIPELDLPRIVVIGCGFAGLKFVKNLNRKRFQVVLLDRNNYHTFQPLMYQVATAGLEPDSVVYPIRKTFKGRPHFHFRMTEVLEIRPDEKSVITGIGSLNYDHLIIATGARSNFFGMKNIEKYSWPMKSLLESIDLRSLILQNFEKSLNTDDLSQREKLMNFVIAGAGPTGVELAGALSELKHHILPADYPDLDIRRMQIHVVEAGSKVLPSMSDHASRKSEEFLRRIGVNVWVNTMVKDFDGEVIKTDKRNFHSTNLIWTAGVTGCPVKGLNIDLTKGDRIPVDEFNRIINKDQIYAIGDVAAIQSKEESPHPMLASVAGQQGKHLAKNFNRSLDTNKWSPFQYKDLGTMATVGRNLALVDFPFAKIGGFIAWLVWMFVHLMLLVDFRNRVVVFTNWAWSYFNYDRGTRLIVRKVNRAIRKEGSQKLT